MRVETYRLSLSFDYPAPSFQGVLEIEAREIPADVAIDAVGLTPGEVEVNGRAVSVEVHPESESWVLRGCPSLPEGRIRISYQGAAASKALEGFYRSRYGDSHIFTTDFEPTAARRFFPCFDRPDLKAVFVLEVELPRGPSVIFNTPVAEEKVRGERRRLTFAPTPRMSTYLFYLGVGPFEETVSHAFRVPVIVAAPAGRGASAAFALEAGTKFLAEYERYYGIPFPLPKMHFIAVPEFGAGAMENWGAIAYVERALLVSPSSSVNTRRRVAEVIAHELAHQWFGNLVTMAWWNDLWLNESFATFVQVKMVDRVYPDYESLNDLLLNRTSLALALDGLTTSHPIQVEVHHPDEIRQVFDQISYGKGASVLRMTEAFLGEEAFRRGVIEYLQAHAYGNARGADLWKHLKEASGQPVDRILGAWTGQAGHPVVSVERKGGGVRVRQRHFLYQGTPSDRLWPVPINYRADGTPGRFLLEGESAELPVQDPKLLLLNEGRAGFYRVRYDEAGYAALRAHLEELSPIDRWGLLDDLYAFLQEGSAEFERYRTFVRALEGTDEFLLVSQLATQLASLARLVGYRGPVAELQRSFLRVQRQRLGVDPVPGEAENSTALREGILLESVLADPEFARTLAGRYPGYDRLDPSLRAGVLTAYARHGGGGALDELEARLLRERSDEEALRFYGALARSSDPTRLERTLRLALEGKVNRIHSVFALTLSAWLPEGATASWEAFQRHREELREVLHGTTYVAQLPVLGIPAWGLRRPEVREYFRREPIPEMDRGTRVGFERLSLEEALLPRLPTG